MLDQPGAGTQAGCSDGIHRIDVSWVNRQRLLGQGNRTLDRVNRALIGLLLELGLCQQRNGIVVVGPWESLVYSD